MTVNTNILGGDKTLSLPRILCLHGGGSNAKIFKAQCRALRAELKGHFRLVFAEGPLLSEPGPDVDSVYKHWGPFKRWLRAGSHHPYLSHDVMVQLNEDALYAAMNEDDMQGATGEWVALMGFSQGAKLAASLLYRQQLRATKCYGKRPTNTQFQFAILLAGRAPLVSLEPGPVRNSALVSASQFRMEQAPNQVDIQRQEHILRLPTIHVHGLEDAGLHLHRALFRDYCGGNKMLVEWKGQHRVPVKTNDLKPLINAINHVAYVSARKRNGGVKKQ